MNVTYYWMDDVIYLKDDVEDMFLFIIFWD